ncbi:UNVERIFIED_CONTAM: Transposon Tf2-11 polyprotein [Sesamum latifolium]|uniref:Transposon Tf2-11 polyprotein n=1 Tax=Sesamum latifolium TaxID=2727402 RepID=A0AAW2V039_9LAMI
MEQMSIQIGLLQRAVSNGPAVAHDAGARLRIPEPKAYNGARDAKEVENFLFDIEQYFLAANVEDEARKVSTATMYLTGDAKLWWRTKYAEIQANQVRLDTWALLREAIREQFFPENVEYNARRALRKLEHSGSVRDYVKSFSALMLDIRDMSEKDKLFTFMEGLKPWARLELQRQRVTDLGSAMAAAERLTDFALETISFLGHIVERGCIRMDPKKVQAIEEWQPPSDVHDLRSFLGLANYYRRFVKGYSEIARPMTDLLKKTETWKWTPQCQESFDNLKRAMVTDPVLALPDMSKPFVVETDASDFALGGVLVQDGHPVAFESRKLKDVERRYSVHEKELLAPKLTSRQARWQELLSEFHFVLEYRAGSSNHVADALSRRADLAGLGSVAALASSAVATSVRDRARELLLGDSAAQGLVHLVEQGKARQFWLEDGLLMTKGNRLYVPKGGDLRKSLISECHDTLGRDIRERSAPTRWCRGPTIGRRCGTMSRPPKHVTAEGTAHLFFKHIVKYWGLPRDIVSDRDSRFTGVFWTELFKILGSKLSMSSSYHPQSDGQTERFNSMLEEYLRHFVRGTQKDWVKLLDVAQLCFNAQKSSSTNKSAFEIVTGSNRSSLTLSTPHKV